MKVLLLDSSEKNLTVGLSIDGEIDTVNKEAWQQQSEFMVDEIDRLLKRHEVSPKEIEALVVTKGPGSYTGVRIALSIAKTMCFAINVPLYLVSSLQARKEGDAPSICLMNARGKRSYFGVYQGKEVLVPDCIKANEEVQEYIAEHPDYLICGDVDYLGYSSKEPNISSNLLSCMDEEHRCLEPLGARPIYLKDDYDDGRFKAIVRKMMPADLDAVLQIEEESFAHPFDRKQMLYEMNENPFAYLYCAVVDHEVVGVIDFYVTFNSCTIARIAVKEAFRRKGIGNLLLGQLLKDCESKSEPVEFVTLEVRASNLKAQAFYKKHKFQQVTVKKGYYEDGEDAIYMLRSLIHA
ncbi:MAG: ribosomal protein S18-alanine N-acetyltransferase [Candidatus Enteromonas sp.]|nr:ribosomal protein S18-alanine N-acetyltransferase [Candidatus Enteromonas sp.]